MRRLLRKIFDRLSKDADWLDGETFIDWYILNSRPL